MNKRKVYPGYFVLGALIIYLVFMVIPGLIGIGFSFTDWSAYTDELNFVGWENFKTIFSPEENYVKVISNTLVFTFVTTIIKNVFGLLLALLLTKHMIKLIQLLPSEGNWYSQRLVVPPCSALHSRDGWLKCPLIKP